MFEFDAELDTLDGVPDQYHALYSQNDEGKFSLDPKLAERLSNGAGAARGLAAERKAKQAAERALAAYKAIGETPEAISARINELEAAADKASGADERVARAKADVEKTLNGQITALQQQLDTERKQNDTDYLAREISDAITNTNAIPHALRPVLRERLRVKRDDHGRSITVLDENGEEVLDGRGEPISVKAYAEKLKAADEYGFAFKPEGKSGAGTTPGAGGKASGVKNPFDPKSKNLTEQQELIRSNPDRARALAQSAGVPVTW